MHELPITASVFQIVLRHAKANGVRRVVRVSLEIGALSDLQGEWIQRYFDRLSQGTVVEGAQLVVSREPIVFRCRKCEYHFKAYSLVDADLSCAQCHSRDLSLVSGRQYQVKSMEVQ
jgi:hydrogenase nickel incorporation protein HypA/HybF